nr:hypothetical protein [Tanacetum cinerariifolium]
MLDWKPSCHRRKRHFKSSLILPRTRALRLSLSLQMSQKYFCSSSGTLSRRSILDICPRVKGVNFTDVPDDDTTLAFLIKLGYKESYHMFIKYSICHIPSKKSRGKGLQRKKTVDDSQETIDVSEEFKPEPKPIKRKTASRRVVMKKVTISAANNIIPEPDVTLELGKSISLTEAKEKEAAKQVHATHARIVTESIPESAKKKTTNKSLKSKLKGVQSLTPAKKEANKKVNTREKTNLMMLNKEGDADHESDDHINDTQDTDDEDDETESDEDEIYKYKIRVRKDEDEEMLNAEVEYSGKGDAQVFDAAKAAKDDSKKAKLPPTSSSLSISSSFGDQFLKLSSDISLVGTVKDTTDAEITSLLDIKIQYEVPHIQSPSVLRVPSCKIEKYVSELKKIDLSAEALAALKTQVPSVVDNYLGSKVGDVFQKEVKKHTANLIQKYSLQQIHELPKHQTPTVDLEQEYKKIPSYILKIKKEQAEKQKTPEFTIKSTDKSKTISESMMMMKTLQLDQTRVRRPKGEEPKSQRLQRSHPPPRKPLKVKPPSKGSKTGKSVSTKDPVEEPITDVVMDDASDDVVHDDNQPQDVSEPNTTKTLNPEWFTQPPRPLTPDPKNKRQVVLDQPEQPCIELEYHFQECFNALNDKLYWNNPKGDRYPFDSSKALPLQGHPGHLTVAANYFFNNDLEYLKSFDLKRTYTTSITKTKATQYEIEWIEDMVPTLWSPTKVGYDKDTLKEIKH